MCFQLCVRNLFDLDTSSRLSFLYRSNLVLKLANSCLENSIYIVQKYLHIGVKYPKFLEVLIIVFSTDEFYFKNNNQISYKENVISP